MELLWLQILERFKRIRVDKIIPWIGKAAIEVANFKQRKHPKELNRYHEDLMKTGLTMSLKKDS